MIWPDKIKVRCLKSPAEKPHYFEVPYNEVMVHSLVCSDCLDQENKTKDGSHYAKEARGP